LPEKIVEAPRALRRAVLPESFTRALYACAPYRGCGHGCRYCDGRAEKYYVEGDFERDIEIRDNLPSLLAEELPSLRDRGMISFGSGVTDAYQPLEEQARVTERCIPLLAEKGWPCLVITKSALIQRDLDEWRKVSSRGGFLLFMTVTGTDEEYRSRFEPGASTYSKRFETLAMFHSAGIITGALAMPLLPFINDDEKAMSALFGALRETGVSFIMPGGLTLRPGRQKNLYLETVAAHRPELLPDYERLYAENRPSGMPGKAAGATFQQRCKDELKKCGLPWTLPHSIYSKLLPQHDSLRILLRDMVELYSACGVSVRPLIASADRYDDWLKMIRGEFRRRRSLPDDWLRDRFLNAVEMGELDTVLANSKLASFAGEVVDGGKVFDYLTLKLKDG